MPIHDPNAYSSDPAVVALRHRRLRRERHSTDRITQKAGLWRWPLRFILLLGLMLCLQGKGSTVLAYESAHDLPSLAGTEAVASHGLLVKFHPGSGRQQRQAALDKVALHAQHFADNQRGARGQQGLAVFEQLVHVTLRPDISIDDALVALAKDPTVVYAEPNAAVQALQSTPNDPSFALLWGLSNTGQSGGTVGADMHAQEAWTITTGHPGVVVAVIDTGIDYTHPDLAANMWINPGEIPGNGIDDDGNGFVDDVYGYDFFNRDGDPRDDHFHGTHVAGTIGAFGNNGVGVVGVNWTVQLMALKFLGASGSGDVAGAISAIQYAIDNGAEVLSNSWGGRATARLCRTSSSKRITRGWCLSPPLATMATITWSTRRPMTRSLRCRPRIKRM